MAEVLGLDHVQLAHACGAGIEGESVPSLPISPGEADSGFVPGHYDCISVSTPIHPAKKAYPALLVKGLADLAERCRAAGYPPITDEPLEGFDRVYVTDPFGNRIELLEPIIRA